MPSPPTNHDLRDAMARQSCTPEQSWEMDAGIFLAVMQLSSS